MDIKSAAKVGFMVVIGALALYFGWRFFSHSDPNRYTLYAVFDDAKGLQRQTPVRMNGVAIGEVKDVGFQSDNLKPRVTMSIDNRFEHKIPTDSKIRITSGLLIQNAQIEIVGLTLHGRLELLQRGVRSILLCWRRCRHRLRRTRVFARRQ